MISPEAEPPPDPAGAAQVGEAQRLPRVLPRAEARNGRVLWAAAEDGCTDPGWRFEARHDDARRSGVHVLLTAPATSMRATWTT